MLPGWLSVRCLTLTVIINWRTIWDKINFLISIFLSPLPHTRPTTIKYNWSTVRCWVDILVQHCIQSGEYNYVIFNILYKTGAPSWRQSRVAAGPGALSNKFRYAGPGEIRHRVNRANNNIGRFISTMWSQGCSGNNRRKDNDERHLIATLHKSN